MARGLSLVRTRGSRAGLDLAKIVTTARGMAPADLTMKAVANELGVDPKALNYHVADRESLLALVSTDAFSSNFATVDIGEDSSWQAACRIFAEGFAASLIETGLLVEHFRLGHSLAIGFLKPGEALLNKMSAAGFDEETAARLAHLLANICIGCARDVIITSRNGRVLAGNIRKALEASEAEEFETLSRLLEAGVPIDSGKQLDLGISLFLIGAEEHLRLTAPARAPA